MSRHLKMPFNRASTEHKQRVHNFWYCIWYEPRAKLQRLSRIEKLATYTGYAIYVIVTPQQEHQQSVKTASTERPQSFNRASTERQQSVNRASTERQHSINWASTEHKLSINWASTEHQLSINWASTERQPASTPYQQSVNSVSMILGVASGIIQQVVLWHLPTINIWAAVMCK